MHSVACVNSAIVKKCIVLNSLPYLFPTIKKEYLWGFGLSEPQIDSFRTSVLGFYCGFCPYLKHFIGLRFGK